jgi:hypothetical protein
MVDKVTETLLEALRCLLAGPVEQRLYRSGKLPGLFANRSGVNAEAATRAISDRLIEVIRTEVKGKTETEWVRLAPLGIEFLHKNDSPVRVLEEVRDLLRLSREGMPIWLLEMQQELRAISDRLAEETRLMNRRLEALSERVDAALRRADVQRLPETNGTPVSWASEALAYLERRRDEGASGPCSFPELFAAVRPRHQGLSLPDFLTGLRRLHDHRAIQLLPFPGSPDKIPEPEYALTDGAALLYYVAR